MWNKATDLEKLVEHSKKYKEICDVKQNLEDKLAELTLCNNLSVLSKKRSLFNTKILNVVCKVVCNTVTAAAHATQTLVICVKNVSEKFVFNSEFWQFSIHLSSANVKSTWNLESALGPGQSDSACIPLNVDGTFAVEKISVYLKFAMEFHATTYTRCFLVQECVIDILYFLDPARLLSTVGGNSDSHSATFSNLSSQGETKTLLPPIKKFFLRLDSSLKSKFLSDILLNDSIHRGFSNIDDLSSKPDISLFHVGSKIEINQSIKDDLITIKCRNPRILCALKAAVLQRLIRFNGVTVEELDETNKEKLHRIQIKLDSLRDDSENKTNMEELMELYLELRVVSESIRFSLGIVVE